MCVWQQEVGVETQSIPLAFLDDVVRNELLPMKAKGHKCDRKQQARKSCLVP